MDKKHEKIEETTIVIPYISSRAFERGEKDRRIKQNLKHYMKEIRMILSDPFRREKESIGDFLVSPRGETTEGVRIAWHLEQKKSKEGDRRVNYNLVFIDDLLYHDTQKHYVDNWDKKAFRGEIKLESYTQTGYSSLTEVGTSMPWGSNSKKSEEIIKQGYDKIKQTPKKEVFEEYKRILKKYEDKALVA
jgi:hypothetical protein